MEMKKRFMVILTLIALSMLVAGPHFPVTGRQMLEGGLTTTPVRSLLPYTLAVQRSGSQDQKVSQVSVRNHFSFVVVEQPANDPGYVSSQENTLTLFRLAERFGSTGLLAHNYLAGSAFLDLTVGDKIDLAYDDGQSRSYWIFSIRKFQAVTPTSPYSAFIDLENGKQYLASELFLEIYGQVNILILQTCLDNQGVESWGRIFLQAFPSSAMFYRPWPRGSQPLLVQ